MLKLMTYASLVAILTTSVASAMGPRRDQYGFRQRGTTPRAAPWFLYWPYGAYWQTPAPTGYYGGWGPMTTGPAGSQIGAHNPQFPVYPGPTGFDY